VVIDHGKVIATGTPDELKTTIGGQTIEVRPIDDADADRVLAVVSEVTAGPSELVEGRITAPVSDPAVLPAIVRRLDEAGVLVGELSLHRSSLDEVFLSLTGHQPDRSGRPGRSDHPDPDDDPGDEAGGTRMKEETRV
jgi:oleandomycin transport system ATP-binding protein